MHLRSQDYAGHLLLFINYIIALFAILGIGSSLCWLIFSLVNYILLTLISRRSQKPIQSQRKVLPRRYERLLTFILPTTCLFFLTANPAYAIFSAPEKFLITCFTQAAAIVSLVFNILRFLLLVYFAISITQGVNAVRDGQAITAVVLPPLVVIGVVQAADMVSGLIISGVTCVAPTP